MKKVLTKKPVVIAVILLLLAITISLNLNKHYIVAERVFLKKNGMTLKVVSAYERLFLHFEGHIFNIQCQSNQTANLNKSKFSSKGWQSYVPISSELIGLNANLDQPHDINQLESIAKDVYISTDTDSLILESGNNVFMSWDGCKSFRKWQAQDSGTIQLAFNIRDFHIMKDGRASFTLIYPSKKMIQVKTSDFGKSWDYQDL